MCGCNLPTESLVSFLGDQAQDSREDVSRHCFRGRCLQRAFLASSDSLPRVFSAPDLYGAESHGHLGNQFWTLLDTWETKSGHFFTLGKPILDTSGYVGDQFLTLLGTWETNSGPFWTLGKPILHSSGHLGNQVWTYLYTWETNSGHFWTVGKPILDTSGHLEN